MDTITLTDVEQRVAKWIAEQRNSVARSNGLPDQKIGISQDSVEIDKQGFGAELAFCKMFNLYPDLDIGHRPPADATLKTGLAVDVKTTKYRNGHLVAPRWKTCDGVDLYVLMVGDFPNYRMAGTLSAEELLREERLTDFGSGKHYAAKQSELRGLQ